MKTNFGPLFTQGDMQYVVLHFTNENEAEAAPSTWLEESDGVLYCYWPQSNVSGLAKKCSMPDQQLWPKYPVRILSETDSYSVARHRTRKGEETSHLDDSHRELRRVTMPRRYIEEDEPQHQKKRMARV
ncbi:hypothetical protein LDENG_00287500 [Lucifuga dentata]|nr:hypothetical protein LDENG_00287500 [Lucifuga dentata]